MRAIDLSTRIGHPSDLITVTEYEFPGDGGGGTFAWYPETHGLLPPLPPEDRGIVFGTSPQGRWIRQWSGYVNVRWFGALGDGKGHDPAIGDTERIQEAICFCEHQKGGTVFFPPGVYVVATRKDTDDFKLRLKSRVNLLGCGASSQIRSALKQNYSSRTLSSEKDVLLEDVTIQSLLIDGRESEQDHEPGKNIQRAAVFIYISNNLKILDCIFVVTADVIRLYKECTGTHICGNEIRDNLIDIGRECIAIAAARDTIVENNYVHDCPFASGVKMEGAHPGIDFSNLIRGNVFREVGVGITATGGCTISDNVIEATHFVGAIVGHHCHFLGNRITAAVEFGIQLVSDDDLTESVVIANNSISNIQNPRGGKCDGIVAEIFKQFKPQKLSISNNIIDNTSTGKESFNGIRLHSVGSHIAIDHNQIYAADCGVRMAVDSDNTTDQLSVTNNTISVRKDGTGVLLGAAAKTNANLRHVVVTGNVVGRIDDTATGTTGIGINGDPDRVLLVGNDTSDTDKPFATFGGPPPAHLVIVGNNGF